MAREFSKAFYKSKGWKKVREYVFNRDNGVCMDCLDKGRLTPGKEVHHIVFLTPDNINDPDITLNEDNLITLCKECHHKRHNNNSCTADDLIFDEMGNLIIK